MAPEPEDVTFIIYEFSNDVVIQSWHNSRKYIYKKGTLLIKEKHRDVFCFLFGEQKAYDRCICPSSMNLSGSIVKTNNKITAKEICEKEECSPIAKVWAKRFRIRQLAKIGPVCITDKHGFTANLKKGCSGSDLAYIDETATRRVYIENVDYNKIVLMDQIEALTCSHSLIREQAADEKRALAKLSSEKLSKNTFSSLKRKLKKIQIVVEGFEKGNRLISPFVKTSNKDLYNKFKVRAIQFCKEKRVKESFDQFMQALQEMEDGFTDYLVEESE